MREVALLARIPPPTSDAERQEGVSLRLRVVKPIRRALAAEDWSGAWTLLDVAEAEIARWEAAR